MMRWPLRWLWMGRAWLFPGAAALAGCGQTDFEADFGVSLEMVQEVIDDEELTSQETREALAALGIDEVTINALLRADRVANQFGGDLRSAFLKISGGRFGELTPDEAQVYGDATQVTEFSDTEAQAIVDFFVEVGVNDADALQTLLDAPGFQIPTGIDDVNLREVFVDFDPDDVIPLIE